MNEIEYTKRTNANFNRLATMLVVGVVVAFALGLVLGVTIGLVFGGL